MPRGPGRLVLWWWSGGGWWYLLPLKHWKVKVGVRSGLEEDDLLLASCRLLELYWWTGHGPRTLSQPFPREGLVTDRGHSQSPAADRTTQLTGCFSAGLPRPLPYSAQDSVFPGISAASKILLP